MHDPFGDYYGCKGERHAKGINAVVALYAFAVALVILGAVLRVVEGLA